MKKIKTIVFSVAVVLVSLFLCSAGCQNVADSGSSGGGQQSGSGGGSAPKISSQAEMNVLGSYKNGIKTLTFSDDLTGSYNDGTSRNSRAASAIHGSFRWSVTQNGDIEIIQGSNTIPATLGNGTITIGSETFTLEPVDLKGKTYTLIYPTIAEMDARIGVGGSYIMKLYFEASGGGTGANRYRDNSGVHSTGDYPGKWKLDDKNHLNLYDPSGNLAQGDIKFSFGNKAYVMNGWGLQIFQSQ